MDEFIVVFVTASGTDEAERIAFALVEGGAAPCVSIVPAVVSVYRWKGELQRDREALLMIKTRRILFERIREIVEAAHSYEVPEIIAVPLTHVSAAYRAYLESYFAESS
jgi:periplasmic divalent cation tolerance protein